MPILAHCLSITVCREFHGDGGEKECFTRLTECSLCHMYIYGFSYSNFAFRIGFFGPGCANSRSLLIYYRL